MHCVNSIKFANKDVKKISINTTNLIAGNTETNLQYAVLFT
jgi:hypothetical protein